MLLLMAVPIGSDLASIKLKALPARAQPVWQSGEARLAVSLFVVRRSHPAFL
jgi:hypothetical protein